VPLRFKDRIYKKKISWYMQGFLLKHKIAINIIYLYHFMFDLFD
jgi:hypothetical protein